MPEVKAKLAVEFSAPEADDKDELAMFCTKCGCAFLEEEKRIFACMILCAIGEKKEITVI